MYGIPGEAGTCATRHCGFLLCIISRRVFTRSDFIQNILSFLNFFLRKLKMAKKADTAVKVTTGRLNVDFQDAQEHTTLMVKDGGRKHMV